MEVSNLDLFIEQIRSALYPEDKWRGFSPYRLLDYIAKHISSQSRYVYGIDNTTGLKRKRGVEEGKSLQHTFIHTHSFGFVFKTKLPMFQRKPYKRDTVLNPLADDVVSHLGKGWSGIRSTLKRKFSNMVIPNNICIIFFPCHRLLFTISLQEMDVETETSLEMLIHSNIHVTARSSKNRTDVGDE